MVGLCWEPCQEHDIRKLGGGGGDWSVHVGVGRSTGGVEGRGGSCPAGGLQIVWLGLGGWDGKREEKYNPGTGTGPAIWPFPAPWDCTLDIYRCLADWVNLCLI